jgi:hypothetical protein
MCSFATSTCPTTPCPGSRRLLPTTSERASRRAA